MSDWQPIDVKPREGSKIILYFANLTYTNLEGEPVSLGVLRDDLERMLLAFFEDGQFWEAGTAHNVFEDWRTSEQLPTHWCYAPDVPALSKANGESGDV